MPGTTGAGVASFGLDGFSNFGLADIKYVRGGSWNQYSDAGVWCADLTYSRGDSRDQIGFRPVLAF
jgi:hypothetical protein